MKNVRMRDFDHDRPIRLFVSYYRPHLRLFILDMVCALMVCIIDLAFPYLARASINTYLPESRYHTFFLVMGICIAAYLFKTLLYYIITKWGHIFGVRVEADIRHDLFSHMQTLSHSFFDKNRTGILMSRVTTDLFEIAELSHHGPEDAFISCVTLVGAIIIMCTIEWRLAVLLAVLVPVFAAFVMWQRVRMRQVNAGVKAKTAEINAQIESGLSGMRTAKAFHNEASEVKKFDAANAELVHAKGAYYHRMAVFNGGMECFMGIMPVIVITAGGFWLMRGQMNLADLFAFTLYTSTFISPIRKLSALVEQLMQGMAGFYRFLDIMRTKPEIVDAPGAKTMGKARGEVEFSHVSFRYETGGEVLHDISVRIPAGSSFAVVGPSGSGKTTMCQLVPRFYEVSSGSVLVDGRDVREWTQESLRSNVGIVQQDVFLFADTVLENIRYGRPDATDEEVAEAARCAEIYEDIMQMPNGFHTYVGERGVMLSGGQKQRISIARIFLKNPPIVILDEATSALDSLTEAKIQESFDRLCEGRTSITIAHRLSTVQGADQIAVIDGNSVVEIGSHAELMAKNGEYAGLVRAQNRNLILE